MINYCVGYDTPIDFKEGALPDWLKNVQSVAKKVMELFSYQFYVDHYGVIDSEEERTRATAETRLQAVVLPELNLRFMAMSPMEMSYGAHICRTNLHSVPPQHDGECTPQTPYVLILTY